MNPLRKGTNAKCIIFVKQHLQEMVEIGAIRKSFSPVALVRKKDVEHKILYWPT